MKNLFTIFLFGYTIFSITFLYGQDTTKNHITTLPEVIQLALTNSTQLKVSKTETLLASQKIEITKLEQLPGISTELEYGYISNAQEWTPSFSEHGVGIIPHHYTDFTTAAAEEIFKGGSVRNDLKKATLEEQIASLAFEKNTEDIKFLVASQYLNIYRYINLRRVYLNNAMLSENQLKNILTMQKQGMVTENDVLRTQLTLSDLRLSIRKTDNDIEILNNQMNIILGRSADTKLIPDSNILNTATTANGVSSFIEKAVNQNYELKISAAKVRIAETNLKLLGSDRYPSLSVYAANAFQRPYINSIPSIDVYYNVWQAGISLKYNISSIYQSPRKIKAGKIALEESVQSDLLETQNKETEVRTHYIKFKEAEDELSTAQSDLKSAEENYRIVEKKYYNQLALLTDLIDATNTKISAETNVTNAEINKVYTYFLLLKSSSGSIGI